MAYTGILNEDYPAHTHLNVASILWLVHTNTHIVNYVTGDYEHGEEWEDSHTEL